MTHTFEVTPGLEIPSHIPLFKEHEADKHWLESSNLKGETLYASNTKARCGDAPLFMAVGLAFNTHVPVTLNPDAVWLTILVGLVHHIDTDPEGLRHHFVRHEGKKELKAICPVAYLRNIAPESWEDVIDQFSCLMTENLNPKRSDLLLNKFSTTTPTDALVSKVVLMGAMKHFFEYYAVMLCGFSKVTIEGTVADWQDIINRTHALTEFGLEWWTKHLIPVLEQFKAAASGAPDIAFWKRAYLTHSIGSGGEYGVSGWIHVFYPYLPAPTGVTQNSWLDWTQNDKQGMSWKGFPSGIVAAPVTVCANDGVHNCEFYAGLVGVSMSEDFIVKPESGFVIKLKTDEDSKPKSHPFNVDGIARSMRKHTTGLSQGHIYAFTEPEPYKVREILVLSADKPSKSIGFTFGFQKGAGIGAVNKRGLKNEDE